MIMNINKHKAAETAAEQRERQLRDELALLSETCQVGLSRHGMDGKFLSVNAAWHDITGVKEGEPLDKWHEKLQYVLVSSNQSFPATNFRLLRSSDDRERVEQAWREYVLTPLSRRARVLTLDLAELASSESLYRYVFAGSMAIRHSCRSSLQLADG
jgi:PAS domain-containing protein